MSIRTERVARLIQRDVADILQGELARELAALVTVTGVRMTKDLSIAYVHVSVMGATPAEKQATFRHLVEITPAVRHALAGRIRNQVRAVPDVRFFLDESYEQAKALDVIFAQIARERGDAPDDGVENAPGADEADRVPGAAEGASDARTDETA